MPFRKKALYYSLLLFLTLLALAGMARLAWSAAYGSWPGWRELPAAAQIARWLGPAGLRPSGENPAEPISDRNAAQPAAEPDIPLPRPPDFQVSLSEDGRQLRYVRAGCLPADTEPAFFLHLIPWNYADLPPGRRESGFNQQDFNFAAAGGQRAAGQCAAQIQLPGYPVKTIRTGQYVPGRGNLWSVELSAAPDPEQLWAEYIAVAAAEPEARDFFNLYVRGNRLIYLRDPCLTAHERALFFLHIFPVDLADLPEERRGQGFARQDFDFAHRGVFRDGRCLTSVPLPDYPIKEIHTGQYIPGQFNLWQVTLITPEQLRAEYAALAAAEPTARDYFDLYVADNRLFYLRESCAAADTAADFFLYIFPEALQDLPEERQGWGFSDEKFFDFGRRGGHFDGKCLAIVTLPDYPIAALQTGQYVPPPGQGRLWLVELAAPADPDRLRADYAALAGVQPAARAAFDLYAADNRLLYQRENCAAADTAAEFFLHIIPENPADLPAERRAAGFVHWGFNFARRGGHFDGKCLAAVPLPDYPIKAMRTGQQSPGQGDLWSVELIAAPDPEQLRADYTALATIQPAARDYFDLYWRDNQLLYLRETCAAGDTAAGFFLHIVPEDIAALPPERRAAGFANADFAFNRWGGTFDGKCLAAVPLPDYPVKSIRTGQHIPGQGEVWAVELTVEQ